MVLQTIVELNVTLTTNRFKKSKTYIAILEIFLRDFDIKTTFFYYK